MGSDMYMNPPKPVWDWEDYEDEDDALIAISVALENGWKIQASRSVPTSVIRVGIHRGEYI